MKAKFRILSAAAVVLMAALFLTSGVALAADQKCDPTKCKEVCKVPCNTATAQATQAAAKDCCKGDSTCCKNGDGKCPMGPDGKCTKPADGKCCMMTDAKSCPSGFKCCETSAAKTSASTDCCEKVGGSCNVAPRGNAQKTSVLAIKS